MIPVVTPEQMAAIDAGAPEPVEVLIERAGAAVAVAAMRLLAGRAYGRHVVVVAGPGNNGADGQAAARRLRRWGAAVTVLDARTCPDTVGSADLVIDAAFGTGVRRPVQAPDVGAAPVLAVDLPSGVDGLTGVPLGSPMSARHTVTFGALKPGLLFDAGRELSGTVEVAPIGLDCRATTMWALEAADLEGRARRARTAHKWDAATWIIGGTPGMAGAPALAAAGALRSGAGYVRRSTPEGMPEGPPCEAVSVPLPSRGWVDEVCASLGRVGALVVGPGLGRGPDTLAGVRRLCAATSVPLVLDGDGLAAYQGSPELIRGAGRVVLTPHEGEYTALTGARPGVDRIGAARRLAARADAVVVLKGPGTVIAAPDGSVRIAALADQRLATAGTGDVLAGVIGAQLALGATPFDAASTGVVWHSLAAMAGPAEGLVASDLPELLVAVTREDQ